MKVLNICVNSVFTENYTYQDNMLSEYQHKIGHDVTVLATTQSRGEDGRIIHVGTGDKRMDNGVRLIRIKHPSKFAAYLGIFTGVHSVIKKVQPDFIFIHGLSSFCPISAIAYKKSHKNIRIAVDNHQDQWNTDLGKLYVRFQLEMYKFFWRKWIDNVDAVYGVTSWRSIFAKQYFGIPEAKVSTLPMGVDSDKLNIDRCELRSRTRQKLCAEKDMFLFTIGGKLEPRKRIIETMRAFTKIQKPSARLLVFGSVSGEIKEDFENLLQTDTRIQYIGYIASSEIYRIFLACDFGLFPGSHSVLWEEAVGCGLPCLFRGYDSENYINCCDNSIVLTNPTEVEIENIMKSILTDKELYERLRMNARKAARCFSYRSIAETSLS